MQTEEDRDPDFAEINYQKVNRLAKTCITILANQSFYKKIPVNINKKYHPRGTKTYS